MAIEAVPERSGTPQAAAGAAISGLRDTLTATASGVAVLLASLVNFLTHNDYPLVRPEVGIVAVLLIVVAAATGVLYAAVGDLGRSVLRFSLVFLALDLNFNVIVAALGTVVIGLVLRRRMLQFVGIAAGVVLVTGLVGVNGGASRTDASPAHPAGSGSDAPVLVHIILDEHIGIEGILGDAPEVSARRDALKRFYAGNGFRLFGGAYSQYIRTVYSVPQMFNFGIEQSGDNLGQSNSTMGANAYFDALGDLGYDIHVRQIDFLDYCGNTRVVSCRTRRSADLHDLIGAAIPVTEKARLTLSEMAKLSEFLTSGLALYDLVALVARRASLPLAPYRLETRFMPTAIGALDTFDQLTEELRDARAGNAYFVHELLPHYPYVMDAACRLKDASEWYNRRLVGVAKSRREAAYFDQISCLLTKLDALLKALASSPAGSNATVIIQGDHGSRITDVDASIENEGGFSDADLIAGYSTLFAVRAPGLVPGYEPRRRPAARLIDALVRSRFRSAEVTLPAGFVHEVMLEDRTWKPVKRQPLPGWWSEAE